MMQYGAQRVQPVVCALLALMSAAAAQKSPDCTPLDLLQRMFDQRGRVMFIAVQTYSSPDLRGPSMTIKIECDGKGTTRRTVLQPLSKQGVVSIDDGKTWTTYLPDSQEMLVQPSPRLAGDRPDQRASLIRANYALTVGVPAKIGGRRALAIKAKPKSPDMPNRVFYLDTRTHSLLRVETVDGPGESKVWVDTKTIEFPAAGSTDVDVSAPTGNWKKRSLPAPEVVPDPSKARQKVGFTPAWPESLADGFVITEVHLLGRGRDAFLGMRLSDGLTQATVYQWGPGRERKGPPPRGFDSMKNDEGVTFQIFGDLPSPVRRRILAAFAK